MIKRIAHVGIVVNSLDEALPFYRDVLGLSLERIQTLVQSLLGQRCRRFAVVLDYRLAKIIERAHLIPLSV